MAFLGLSDIFLSLNLSWCHIDPNELQPTPCTDMAMPYGAYLLVELTCQSHIEKIKNTFFLPSF